MVSNRHVQSERLTTWFPYVSLQQLCSLLQAEWSSCLAPGTHICGLPPSPPPLPNPGFLS